MKTLIFDSNYLCYSSYFAMGDLKFHDNGTGVIFGFLSQLYDLANYFDSNHVVFCWDSRNSLRKQKHAFYKNREKTEDLREAFKQFKELQHHVLPYIGFRNIFIQGGYEADDLIASFVQRHKPEGGDKNIIISSDNDLLQLLDDANMYVPRKKQLITKKSFMQEYEIQPKEWAHVKALAGCDSDTVPGIPGIGIKTAIKYLRGRLKPGKLLDAIESKEGIKIYNRNLRIVQLPYDHTSPPRLKEDVIYEDYFIEICKEYGFKSFLDPGSLADWRRRFLMK